MALLQTHNLTAHYGDFQALFGVDIELEKAETIAIIGANGAGKTTLMRSIAGVLRNAAQAVTLDGTAIGTKPADEIMAQGIAMVPEGRKLFPSLSVEENLMIGTYGRKTGGYWTLETVYELFPILRERRALPSTALSGGQQQMVAIGRALMANPKMILLDEPSMGLAPQLVEEIFEIVKDLNQKERVSFLLAEQNTMVALRYAEFGYILENGRVVMEGAADSLSENEDVKEFYLGLASDKRKSFRDVKHYRRRKRWL